MDYRATGVINELHLPVKVIHCDEALVLMINRNAQSIGEVTTIAAAVLHT